ncbi:MAG: phosphatase PAP2 family protein [Alphaproteobacteria bacterium]|nr:phosphatase PAP2 family protein [Alphaproteobacteria bacterium]
MTRFRTLGIILLSMICKNACAISALEELGNYTQVMVPTYAFGMAISENDFESVRQFIYSFGSMELTVFGLKSAIKEPRPDKSDKNSFPSGHTASAVSGAAFIHKRYGIKRAIIPYMMAGFTGYTRIRAEKHHFHDVVAGAAISGLFTWMFVSRYDGMQVSASPEAIKMDFKTEF